MITVSIITKNEERNIERCLNSVGWADEIIIVDSGSSDQTLDICKKYQCKIIHTEWLGFGLTKKIGVLHSKNDWILSIDADEVVSIELANKIQDIILSSSNQCFRIKRNSFYLGKEIKYSGWQNDYPIRLFNKKFANFNEKKVHEKVVCSKSAIKVNLPIFHYPFNSIEQHIKKIDLYSSLGAQELLEHGKKVSFFYPFFSFMAKFIKVYFIRLGFLDGKEGFILAVLSSFYSFLKYIKLWTLIKEE